MDSSANIYAAACGGDVLAIRSLYQDGASLDITNGRGDTGMFGGAKFGHTDVIEVMHELGSDINAVNNFLATPIYTACIYGQSLCVSKLVELGADISLKDEDGHTPLHGAALAGYCDVVRLVIALGADIPTRDYNGQTALSLAASYGRADVVAVLHELGAQIDSCDNYGLTPLHLAAECCHPNTAQLLIGRGAVVDARAVPPALDIQASADPSGELARPDLAFVSDDPDSENSSSNPSVASSASSGSPGRADAAAFSGYTPLLMASVSGFVDIIILLNKAGADLDACAADGLSPLRAAAENGNAVCVRYLIGCGVPVGNLEAMVSLVISVRLVFTEFDMGCVGFPGTAEEKRDIGSLVKLTAVHFMELYRKRVVEPSAVLVSENLGVPLTEMRRRLELEHMICNYFAVRSNVVDAIALLKLSFYLRCKIVKHMVGMTSSLPDSIVNGSDKSFIIQLIKLFFNPTLLSDLMSLRLTCRSCEFERRFPVPQTHSCLEVHAVERFVAGDIAYYISTESVRVALMWYGHF